jgi:hypothetical protein
VIIGSEEPKSSAKSDLLTFAMITYENKKLDLKMRAQLEGRGSYYPRRISLESTFFILCPCANILTLH